MGNADMDMDSGAAVSDVGHNQAVSQMIPRDGIEYIALHKRGLSQSICKKYGYGTTKHKGNPAHVWMVKGPDGNTVAQKLRYGDKKMMHLGNAKGDTMLFGQWLCRDSGKMIVVTEGEIDAMSVCQSMGMSWPAVSITKGAAGAKSELLKHIEFLESYDKVVLMFDQDEAGQKATQQCVELFSPGKVSVANLGGYKDANEALQAGESKLIRDAVWAARPWRPDGIINLDDIKERIFTRPEMGNTYPWPKLNEMLYGYRDGELTTWTAGTGVGKTALVSELLYHNVLEGRRTGIIYLEEGSDIAGRRLVGLHMDKPVHLPNVAYSDEEFAKAYEETVGTRLVSSYDHFGSLESETLLNRVRYMVKSDGCRTIILDHVSMVVSGQDMDIDERKMLDYIMTKLRSLTQETGASIHVVCHLRRTKGGAHEEGAHVSINHLRGTQAIAQLSNTIIAAERDQQADDETVRNQTQLRVLKNRYAGITGPADLLFYNRETGRLTLEEITDDFDCPF
jgi:twinkle protein